MIIEKDVIRCESIFDETHSHRFLWKRVWNKEKPLIAVVMLNPCQADTLLTDVTSDRVVNNVVRLEQYGGVVVLNLFSLLTTKLDFRWSSNEELNAPENDGFIKKAAEDCDTVVLAWGKATNTNQRVADRAAEVIKLLEGYSSKLHILSDGVRSGLHPLTPSLRTHWILEPFKPDSNHEPTAKA